MILTTRFDPCRQDLDGIHESHLQDVHRQIDGTAAADLGARVVPLDARRQYLELAGLRSDMPTAAVGIFNGMIAGVGLAENRERA
jgi:hypothetical protein